MARFVVTARREEDFNFRFERDFMDIIDLLWEILYEDDPTELKRFLEYYKYELPGSVLYQALGWATNNVSDINTVYSLIDTLKELDMQLYSLNFYSLLFYKQNVPEFDLQYIKDMVSQFSINDVFKIALSNKSIRIIKLLFKEKFLRHTKKNHDAALSTFADNKSLLLRLVMDANIVPIGECGEFLVNIYKKYKDPEFISFLIHRGRRLEISPEYLYEFVDLCVPCKLLTNLIFISGISDSQLQSLLEYNSESTYERSSECIDEIDNCIQRILTEYEGE